MADYYEVVVAVTIGIQKNGKDKINNEFYLVNALSVTEAESLVVDDFTKAKTQLEFNVSSVKESKIIKVID